MLARLDARFPWFNGTPCTRQALLSFFHSSLLLLTLSSLRACLLAFFLSFLSSLLGTSKTSGPKTCQCKAQQAKVEYLNRCMQATVCKARPGLLSMEAVEALECCMHQQIAPAGLGWLAACQVSGSKCLQPSSGCLWLEHCWVAHLWSACCSASVKKQCHILLLGSVHQLSRSLLHLETFAFGLYFHCKKTTVCGPGVGARFTFAEVHVLIQSLVRTHLVVS